MDLARYLVEAVVLEGRTYREVARAHGVSKSWVGKLVGRFRSGGYEAIAPRSRAPNRVWNKTPAEVEDEIVSMRGELEAQGLDAGAVTIHFHLCQRLESVPSVSTIWRVLKRRGLITPQPHKRPRSSWVRFEAAPPNECWQSDVTHFRLADGRQVDIVNLIDDHSRAALASKVVDTATTPDVIETFRAAASTWGYPASVLTDNGCVYTAWHRGGTNAFEAELARLGVVLRHSRPYHPQTIGKVERFHQTIKAYLAKQPQAHSIEDLQGPIDRFIAYYNDKRPHRAKGRMTPSAAFEAKDKARPAAPKLELPTGARVRRDRVDEGGKLTLRHAGRLHHIGVGAAHRHKSVIMLVAGLDVRILTEGGELLRHFTLDPSRDYQAAGASRVSTMS